MDSKSVRRVADSLGLKANYDAKMKTWMIGDQPFTADVIAKMDSKTLRGKFPEAASSDSAAQKPTNTKTSKAKKEPKTKGARKVKAADVGKETVEVNIKVSMPAKKKAKRDGPSTQGNVWLPTLGVHKWQMRQKLEGRGAEKDVVKLAAEPRQWYTPAEIRTLSAAIFDATDKQVLKSPEKYTEATVKNATDARDVAERMIEAANAAKEAKEKAKAA